MSKRRRRRREDPARRQLKSALAGVTFVTPYPQFICDVFLKGEAIGSYAEDAHGIVTFDRNGQRFGRRKQLRRNAIVAIVARAIGSGR